MMPALQASRPFYRPSRPSSLSMRFSLFCGCRSNGATPSFPVGHTPLCSKARLSIIVGILQQPCKGLPAGLIIIEWLAVNRAFRAADGLQFSVARVAWLAAPQRAFFTALTLRWLATLQNTTLESCQSLKKAGRAGQGRTNVDQWRACKCSVASGTCSLRRCWQHEYGT